MDPSDYTFEFHMPSGFIMSIQSILTFLEYVKVDNDVLPYLGKEHRQSDLVSGVYEGGLKVWEGTFDLLKYLESNPE